ncbi:vesicle transport protein SEC20 [Cylas formicarius]|uniref:vesicle transport protein SEC20 n=1 Tax=Cylas formicarius TaxID=197179 RepID=UPI002958AA8B|nr:vesicle transport protein SEC20 [Cylas formicarius]
MDSTEFILKSIRNDMVENQLHLKAIIQDINFCSGSLSELNNLNSLGRSKISALRKLIDRFGDVAKDNNDHNLLKEVVLAREQLASTMDAFKKANLKSMLAIEKGAKEELLKSTNEETGLKYRQKRDKESMVKMSANVTDQLLSISRQLAETTKQSAHTLDTLLTSSDTVLGTQDELRMTSGAIGRSGKLLNKYGRRELTDKVLVFFAFSFFAACVVYIVQKRLF